MRAIIVAILFAFIVSGCQSNLKPQFETKIITKNVYPNLVAIPIPKKPALKTVEWDFPRDMTQPMYVRNSTTCTPVPESQRNKEFWMRCGLYPIDKNSNLYIGLDEENFNNLSYNMRVLSLRDKQLQERLKIINSQRKEWIRKNKSNL